MDLVVVVLAIGFAGVGSVSKSGEQLKHEVRVVIFVTAKNHG